MLKLERKCKINNLMFHIKNSEKVEQIEHIIRKKKIKIKAEVNEIEKSMKHNLGFCKDQHNWYSLDWPPPKK